MTMEEKLKSNHTLEDQFKKEIVSGTLPWHMTSLLFFIFWVIYISFYHSRTFGLLLSIIIRRLVKKYYINIGSVSISALSGTLMLGNFHLVADDYSFKCHDIVIIFNFWKAFKPSLKAEEQERCLRIILYGMELHHYNRTQVYDELKAYFASQRPRAPPPHPKKRWGKFRFSKLSSKNQSVDESKISPEEEAQAGNDKPTADFNDSGWLNWRELFPIIKAEIKVGKICFGNHLMPAALCISCDKGHVTYSTREASYKWDRFQHHVEFDYTNLQAKFTPVSRYSGIYAAEPPPKNAGDSFKMIHWGKGKINYYQDEPGVVSLEPNQVLMSDNEVSVTRTYPQWLIDILVVNDCRIAYGPWADRQRELLWKFFFPASFQAMTVSEEGEVGTLRQFENLKMTLNSKVPIQLELIFTKDDLPQIIHIDSHSGTNMEATIPWLIKEQGYTSNVKGEFIMARCTVTHECEELLRAESLDFCLDIHYPRHWNAHQTWDLNMDVKNARCHFVYDYKKFFVAMIDEWGKDSRPDLLSFVPYTYRFNIDGHNFELVTLANDYNWIANNLENAHIALLFDEVQMKFDLPFIDFLPDRLPVAIEVLGQHVKARLSIPESSTALYTLVELQSHMKLTDRNGKPLPNQNIFLHEEELVMIEKNVEKRSIRHWLQCWDSPEFKLNVTYTYHPLPYVPNYWRFLSREYLSNQSDSGIKSDHKASRKGRKIKIDGDDPPKITLNERGPKADYLHFVGFDPGYMDSDLIEVDIQLPSSTVLLFGSLLRHFLHVKENYFGCTQTPIKFDSGVVKAEDYIVSKAELSNEALDPRQYRPFSVKLKLAFHSIHAHLVKHCSSPGAPCPSAFVDCVSFELNKNYTETMLQVLISPIVILVPDKCRERSSDFQSLSEGVLVVEGLQVRGHAMFSHEDLPLDSETLEYAWLMEFTVGRISGQLTAIQLTTLVQSVQTFVFLVVDSENELIPSHDFKMCIHGYPQSVCKQWHATQKCACPTESDLKYNFIRLSVDGVDLYIVEAGTSLQLCFDPIRLSTCDLHGPNNKEGISAVIPRISLVQYVRPVRSLQSNETAPLPEEDQMTHNWLEAASVCMGPILVNAGIALPMPEYRLWQDSFLKKHDRVTKRLWFIWTEKLTEKGDIVKQCGCYGGCRFFGENESGISFMQEVSKKCGKQSEMLFHRRALLPPPELLVPGEVRNNYEFGVSLLDPSKYIFELHDHAHCNEATSGIFLLRDKKYWSPIINEYNNKSETTSTSSSSSGESMARHDSFSESIEANLLTNANFKRPDDSLPPAPPARLNQLANQSIIQTSLDEEQSDLEGAPSDNGDEAEPDKRYISLHSLISSSSASSTDHSSEDMTQEIKIPDVGQDEPSSAPSSAPHPGEEPEKLSEDWDDIMAKYVDLRSQLSSHITESSLLRNAYERHLSEFVCGPWAVGLKLKRRWTREQVHRNPRFTQTQKGFSPRLMMDRAVREPQMAENETSTKTRNDLPEDISTASINSGSSNSDSSAKSTATVRLQGSVDLLLTPLLLESMQRYIEVLTPEFNHMHPSTVVDNLHFQCVSFTKERSKPIQPTNQQQAQPSQDEKPLPPPPSSAPPQKSSYQPIHEPLTVPPTHLRKRSIFEEFLSSKPMENKVRASLTNETGLDLKTEPSQTQADSGAAMHSAEIAIEPPASGLISRSSSNRRRATDQEDSEQEEDKDLSSSWEDDIDKAEQARGTTSESGANGSSLENDCPPNRPLHRMIPRESKSGTGTGYNTIAGTEDCGGAPKVNRRQLAISIERVNVCCLQLSAVEDLVHSDTITTGLHDLTCVSLLAFSLDGASFEVLINQRREAVTDLDTFNRDRLRHQRARQRTLRQQLAARTTSMTTTKTDEVFSPHAAQPPPREKKMAAPAAGSPKKPSNLGANISSSNIQKPLLPQRMKGRPENPLSFIASVPSSESNSDQEEPKVSLPAGGGQTTDGLTALIRGDDDQISVEDEEDDSDSLEEAGESRRTEELISNIQIKRIHVQLRRLTKSSHFSNEVLLTAIPFNQSKVLFCFESDPKGDLPPSNEQSILQQRLEERCSGWIMFECGLEKLTLTCVRRRGFNEGVDDYHRHNAPENIVTIEEEVEINGGKLAEGKPQRKSTNKKNKFTPAPDQSDTGNENEEESGERKNAFLSRLNVKNVWLNFPAPKRLPNKRRIDITRYDWNLLSTATPTIKAWMNPSDRLIAASKELKHAMDRRILSVVACLMTQALLKDEAEDSKDERFNMIKMPKGKEKNFLYYDTWRTPISRALLYEPTCQIFTVFRRYMHQKPERVIQVESWLKEDTLPPTVTLQRGILALTREWRFHVDIFHYLPSVEPLDPSAKVSLGFTFGSPSGALNHAATTTNLLAAAAFQQRKNEFGSGNKSRLDVVNDEETGCIASDDENPDALDEANGTEYNLMQRFLHDAKAASSGTFENADSNFDWTARKQQASSLERDRHYSLPHDLPPRQNNTLNSVMNNTAMANQYNQAVHLRTQFQYMEDAQKLFRPLLEAVGLHVKGIRRTTLMKKFGGFFSADGMLESFQVDILQSEGNPLKVSAPTSKPMRTKSVIGDSTQQSAFFCHRFASKMTMRDVIGFERHSVNKVKKDQPDVSQVDIKPTTTQVNVLLHIDHIRQHVNMPLLRLVHQFITMIYSARDTREELEKKKNLFEVDFIKKHRKQHSKGSSNGTDTTGSTMKSKSSNAARQQEDTPPSSSGDAATSSIAQQELPPVTTASVVFTIGKSRGSSPSLVPGAPLGENTAGLIDYGPSASPQDGIPACWKRLYGLVELCSTVPEPKTVNIKPHPQAHLENEEIGHSSYGQLASRAGAASVVSAPQRLDDSLKKEHKRTFSAASRLRTLQSDDVEMGLRNPSTSGVSTPGDQQATTTFSNHPNLTNAETPDQTNDDKTTNERRNSNNERRSAMQRFTHQWFHGERIPIVVFASAKVRKMDMSAVLSELKLDAAVLNIHGSFTHITRLRGRGNFTEKSSEHSLSAHCGDSEVVLREGSPPDTMVVVHVQAGRSHFLLSCERNKRGEKNSAILRLGKIDIKMPHHPVKLHDMMQRSAKRLSSTMSEFMRSTQANQRQRPADPIPEDTFAMHGLQKTKIDDSPPLIVNVTAVAQGLTVMVALHPTLNAFYVIEPVYLVGKISSNGFLDVSLPEHSLTFKSQRPPHVFPKVSIKFPHILLSVTQRYADAGAYLASQRKLTEGLTNKEGSYIDAHATVSTLEKTLSTDELNYIIVVVKLFMKEINEVIQKMAGEEQFFTNLMQDLDYNDPANASGVLPDSRLLNRAARGDTRFTFRARMQGIRLTATTHLGAVKLDLLDIEVELSNRVLAARTAKEEKTKQSHGATRSGSTKSSKKSRSLPRHQDMNTNDSIFFFGKVGNINVELGLLDRDTLYDERNPELETLAFFKTTVALRSLLANEIIPAQHGDQDAFLISLIRPIVWVKPTAFDRGILLWMLYKNEFEKWNEHIKMLSVQVNTPTNSSTPRPRQSSNRIPPPVNTANLSTLFLQLTVEDLGICLPTGISQSASDTDSRSAIILTLDSSRISACFRSALVSEGEFSGFCLRFDDEFNRGLDDWKPSRDRSIIKVNNEEKLVVMNACVVPNGTFQICSKTMDKIQKGDNDQWVLNVIWKMRGLDVHLDTNISRKMKIFFETLTSMTGYDAAKAFPMESSSYKDLHDVDSLDQRYKMGGDSNKHRLGSLIEFGEDYYSGDKRTMELQRQQIQLLEAQMCKNYKRTKWNSFLKKGSNQPHGKLSKRSSTSGIISKGSHHGPHDSLSNKPFRSISMMQPSSMEEEYSDLSGSGVISTYTASDDDEDNSEWQDAVEATPPTARAAVRAAAPLQRPNSLSLYPSNSPPIPPARQGIRSAQAASSGDSGSRHFFRLDSEYYDPLDEKNDDNQEGSDDNLEFEEALEDLSAVNQSSSGQSSQSKPGLTLPSVKIESDEPESQEPVVDLKLDVIIHVDCGNCVLHPRLSKTEERQMAKLSERDRERGIHGGTLYGGTSADDQLQGLLQRYATYLMHGQKGTDITVFYLPAVGVKLHYNSKTEQDSSPTNTLVNNQTARNKKKRADLYASCSIMKLPKEIVVNPSLLDFFEQTLEVIPFLPEWKTESPAASDNESTPSILSSKAESFPVDVVVHINVQPSNICFTCLPTSQMQCLMTLPLVDLVFSTKRNAIGLENNAAETSSVQRASLSRTLARYHYYKRTNPSHVPSIDTLSEGGLCVSAVLKEFSISVYHPYGTTHRDEAVGWDSGRSNSLCLTVQTIRVNISRTRQTTVVTGVNHHLPGQSPPSGAATLNDESRGTIPSGTSTGNKQSDSLNLHNSVKLSGVCDIGCAKFKYDTRRTLEILAIPTAWYRSKLARRLFLGDEPGLMGDDPVNDNASKDAYAYNTEADYYPNSAAAPTYFSMVSEYTGSYSAPTTVSRPTHRRLSSHGDKLLKQKMTSRHAPAPKLSPESANPPRLSNRKDETIRPAPDKEDPKLPGAGGGGSLGATSWQTLLIFCSNLKSLEVEMYMGSAMGITTLRVDQLFCTGRAMMDSAKKKNTKISVGLSSLAFNGENGIVGGELAVSELSSHMHIHENPLSDPEHGFEVHLKGLQLRLEYMTTNILFGRISGVEVKLHDEWKMREPDLTSPPPAQSTGTAEAQASSQRDKGSEEKSTLDPNSLESNIVIVILGELNWDQFQVAIARTTTPDLIKSVNKLKDYFQEQIREGRRSLLNNSDWIGLTSAGPVPDSTAEKDMDAKEFINKIYQRHWQEPFELAAKSYLRLINSAHQGRHTPSATAGTTNIGRRCSLPGTRTSFILGGSLQLMGNCLGVACFSGNFRSAPDWAVFNVQYPTLCFETEAQRDPTSGGRQLCIREVLSCDLGQQMQTRPQMTYVIKAKRGRENPTKNPLSATIAEWFEFAFKPADHSVLTFLKNNDSSLLPGVVQLIKFPEIFIVNEKRPNPLKISTEGEILFVVPSISLRLTTDHLQDMEMPSSGSSSGGPTADTTSETNSSSTSNSTAPPPPKVQMSFQTDFHGILHLGLIDVPWLPTLIRSYINEKIQESNDIPDPDLSERASTGSPFVRDVREYDVVHWVLSPKCRWLLANNVGVPAFDRILENIGFRKARSTIPKWIQRGVMDHLDLVLALLVQRVIRLMQETDEIEFEEEEDDRVVKRSTNRPDHDEHRRSSRYSDTFDSMWSHR